jgi:signal transduction histidine kinase
MTFSFCPSPDLFATLFPFHLIFDRDLSITQVGPVLQRLYPFILSENKDFHEHFRIRSPNIAITFDSICSRTKAVFLIALRHNGVKLKGQMFYVEADDVILFIGSPVIRDGSRLGKYGLKAEDFLTHDPTTDLLFLLETQKSALIEAEIRAHKLAIKQAEINAALAQEQELSELKTRFINTASHEFRTPLGVISSSAGLLEDYGEKLNADKKRKHFKQIQGSVKHMTTLLEDILLINQTDAEKLECKKSPVDLIDFCHELVDEIATSHDAENRFVTKIRSIDSAIELQDTFPVYIDRKLVRQILFNLLSNALKYSFPDSEINFEVEIESHNIIFRVIDRGIGIIPEDRVKLFESFHRGSNVSNIQGTGLGLSIVKRCVTLHGGTIDLTSEVNVGSTFTVNLPINDFEQSSVNKPESQFSYNSF